MYLKSKGMKKQEVIRHFDLLDDYTKEHSKNVAQICEDFSSFLNISEYEKRILTNSAVLHDIGKICISKDIFTSNKQLTAKEYEMLKKHPVYGCDIVKKCYDLDSEGVIILFHHERWDGKGYPSRRREHKIPKLSRILNIVDAFDAMTSERSYRKKFVLGKAIQELRVNKNTQFDGELVELFINFLTR